MAADCSVNPEGKTIFPAKTPLTIVVLASGQGTLFQSLVNAWGGPGASGNVRIAALVCDKPCPALQRAKDAGIPTQLVPLPTAEPGQDRAALRREWDQNLARAVAAYEPDLVVSAGFMRIVGPAFLHEFGGRMINTHPALLPAFPGAHAVPDAVAYGAKVTGSTIHLVDAGVDTGPILAQEAVPIFEGDSPETVHERIKVVERRLIVSVIEAIAQRGFTSDGRKAFLLP